MCTLRNLRWITAAKRANEKFVFEFSTSLCWLGLLFFCIAQFLLKFSHKPFTRWLGCRVWMRRKKVLFLKEEVCSKILIYAMRLIQFSCSRYLWWLENVLFVSGRLTYCWRSGGSIRGEEELQFLGQQSRTNCSRHSHSSFSVEREVTELDFIFYYFRFISIFPLSDERSTIWHVNPFSRVFFCDEYYMCCNRRAIDGSYGGIYSRIIKWS